MVTPPLYSRGSIIKAVQGDLNQAVILLSIKWVTLVHAQQVFSPI